jgi:RNA 3'-terminal phosphate cyclase (ATP)
MPIKNYKKIHKSKKMTNKIIETMESTFIDIDGSKFEGGGQILRLSLSLSIIKQIPVCIYNIRAGRESPGLANSHLAALNLLTEISNAKVTGNAIGSQCVTFVPGKATGGAYQVNCNSAGSITLIVQAVLPVLIGTSSRITITGGTDVSFSPTTHYITHVFKPFLSKIGINFDYEVQNYGFYPKGMGKIILTTYPSIPTSIVLLENTFGSYEYQVLHNLRYPRTSENSKYWEKHDEIEVYIKDCMNIPQETNIIQAKSIGKAFSLVFDIWCNSEYGLIHNSLIQKFKGKESSVQEVCQELIKDVNDRNAVDQYLQDQVVVFLAMAHSPSQLFVKTLTPHTLAVIDLIHTMRLGQVTHDNCVLTISPYEI